MRIKMLRISPAPFDTSNEICGIGMPEPPVPASLVPDLLAKPTVVFDRFAVAEVL
jgi:hypothetical protein